MTTVPYTSTQADLEFHSVIMMEHCVFLHLGIEEEPYKTQAYEQYQRWKQFIDEGYNGDVATLLLNLRILKTTILTSLLEGKWLGWLSASFVRHILEELEEFALLLQGRKFAPEVMVVHSWRLMTDHLEDAVSKTDPMETEVKHQSQQLLQSTPTAIHQLANRDYNVDRLLVDYQEASLALAQEQGQPANDIQWMIGLTLRAGVQIDALLASIQTHQPKTVIHPMLLDHWRREGHHHSQELEIALQELRLPTSN